MLGGAKDNVAMRREAAWPGRGDQHERPFSGALVLVGCVAASVLIGLLVAARPLDTATFVDVRSSLETVTGVVFFGAGLLQLSIWRVDRDPARGHTGLALVVLGFLMPRITALGPMLHDDPAAAVLSPWTAAVVALLALALGAKDPSRLDRFVAGHSRAVAATCGFLLLVMLSLPLVLRRGLPFAVDVPAPVHLLVELGIAALWFTVAAHVTAAAPDEGRALAGMRLWAALVATLGAVWLLRAAAVVDVQPWAFAATVLMTLTGVVALAGSATSFAEVAEVRDRRVAQAERALAAASEALTEVDVQRRSFRHDARNTMFALRAAALVLAEHGDELDAATRRRLRDAIRSQLTELEELLAAPTIPAQRKLSLLHHAREIA